MVSLSFYIFSFLLHALLDNPKQLVGANFDTSETSTASISTLQTCIVTVPNVAWMTAVQIFKPYLPSSTILLNKSIMDISFLGFLTDCLWNFWQIIYFPYSTLFPCTLSFNIIFLGYNQSLNGFTQDLAQENQSWLQSLGTSCRIKTWIFLMPKS